MKNILDELSGLKKEIDKAKNNKAKLEGREQEVSNQLKTEHNLDSVANAEKEVGKLTVLLSKKEEEIRKEFGKLKTEYDW